MSISTGCPVIDKALSGGIPLGLITFIYGDVGTGKTTISLQVSAQAALRNFKFIYVNALGKLSTKRLADIFSYLDSERLSNGIIISVRNFQELYDFLIQIEDLMNPKVRLVIVDTLTRLYRLELSTKAVNVRLNKQLNQIMALLFKITRYYQVAVLATGDIRVSPEVGEEPVAAKIIKYWSDILLRINKTEMQSRRLILVEKHKIHSLIGTRVLCVLSKFGLRGVEIEPPSDST